jgi:8-oxo-dGTP pyrophosphatase MutT (NUDIX family)
MKQQQGAFLPPHGAGVLVHDGHRRLLLGLHRDGWTTFAGKAEPGETPQETALRECGEETLFVLPASLSLSAEPLFTSRTPGGRPFYLYGVAGRIFDKEAAALPGTFAAVRRSRRYAATPGCGETRALRWFGFDELRTARLRPSFRTDVQRIVAVLEGEEGGGSPVS